MSQRNSSPASIRFVVIACLLLAHPLFAQRYFGEDFEGLIMGGLCSQSSCANTLQSRGWAAWDDVTSAAGLVSNARARSGSLSLSIANGRDAVQPFALNDPVGHPQSGRWRLVAYQWIDGASFTPGSGAQYLIVNTVYNSGGPHRWALQLVADPNSGLFSDIDRGGFAVSVAVDRWVEIALDIDLDNDLMTTTYDGQLISTGAYRLPDPTQGGGPLAIANLDLYAPPGTSVAYYDDITLGRFEYQVNSPQAQLDVNGFTSDGSEAAHALVPLQWWTTLSFASSLGGAPYDALISLSPLVSASGGGIQTPGGQIVNLDLLDPQLRSMNSGTGAISLQPFPGNFQLGFGGTTVPIVVSLQAIFLDPAAAEGFHLSQATQYETATPPPADVEAPAVSVTNFSPGQQFVVGTAVTPNIVAIDVVDPNPSISAQLDGLPFTPGTAISSEGLHRLEVRAVDAAGNVGLYSTWFEILARPLLAATGVVQSLQCAEVGGWADLQVTVVLGASAFDVLDIALYSVKLWGLNSDGLPLNRKPVALEDAWDPIQGGYNHLTVQATYRNGYWELSFSVTVLGQELIACPNRLLITGTGLHGQAGEFDFEAEISDLNPDPNAANQLQQLGLTNNDPVQAAPPAPQWPPCKWKIKHRVGARDEADRYSDTSCINPAVSDLWLTAEGVSFGGHAFAIDSWCFGDKLDGDSVASHQITTVWLEGPSDCCNPNITITAIPRFKAEVAIDPPAEALAAGFLQVKSTLGNSATAVGGVNEGAGQALNVNLGAGVTTGKDGPGGGATIGTTLSYTGNDQASTIPIAAVDTQSANVGMATIVVGTSSTLHVRADGHAFNVAASATADLLDATPNITVDCLCAGGCAAAKTFTIK